MDNGFVLGVIASEGCFSVEKGKSEHYSFGINPVFSFGIGMRSRDKQTLIGLNESVGVGKIKSGGKKQTKWLVCSQSDVKDLIEFIESNKHYGFIETSKFESYRKWRDLWYDRDELIETESGMKELVSRATEINPDDARRGRDIDEVHDIIEESCEQKCPWRSKQRLKSALEENEYVYRRVAEEWDCDKNTISKWESKHNISEKQ